jgi:hypothetical protein
VERAGWAALTSAPDSYQAGPPAGRGVSPGHARSRGGDGRRVTSDLAGRAARSGDSLEVRWIVPGPPETAIREWFARFPSRRETREDVYLLRPRLLGLSVKLRDGGTLDVKSYLGSPGVIDLPGHGQGRLESWRKWSFPYRQAPPGDDPASAGWATLRKERRAAWFPLPSGQDPALALLAAGAGCLAELTDARVGGEQWWSVGLEATGSAGLLGAALQHAADLLFAQPLPLGGGLSLDNCRSYAQWLHEQPGPYQG